MNTTQPLILNAVPSISVAAKAHVSEIPLKPTVHAPMGTLELIALSPQPALLVLGTAMAMVNAWVLKLMVAIVTRVGLVQDVTCQRAQQMRQALYAAIMVFVTFKMVSTNAHAMLVG
jgi:hypothetical protein